MAKTVNEFIKRFLDQRSIDSPYFSDDGSVVFIFDKRYRVQLIPLSFNRIALRSFVCFLPERSSDKDAFLKKVMRVMQSNLFSLRVALVFDSDQQSIYAQSDVFHIESVAEFEEAIEIFLNALIFFKEIMS